MCSINGFISQKPISKLLAKRLSSALIYYGSVRGNQSAGVYSNGFVAKQAIEPAKFISTDSFGAAFSQDTSLVLGHTRFPTCGKETDKQAQPFTGSSTITVHNGWYTNMSELKSKWDVSKPSGVDSELVTSFIDSYGIMMLPSFLASTSGPSAIAALYNGELYLAASGNPIAYCALTFEGNQILVFASTAEILLSALSYCFLSLKFDVKTLEDGFMYRATPKRVKVIATIESKKYSFGWKDDLDKIIDDNQVYDTYDVYNDKFYMSREEMVERLVDYSGEEFRDSVEELNEYELDNLLYDMGLYK